MSLRRLVIFDVDGTLVDSQNDIVAAMTGAFAAQGLAAPPRPAYKRKLFWVALLYFS